MISYSLLIDQASLGTRTSRRSDRSTDALYLSGERSAGLHADCHRVTLIGAGGERIALALD